MRPPESQITPDPLPDSPRFPFRIWTVERRSCSAIVPKSLGFTLAGFTFGGFTLAAPARPHSDRDIQVDAGAAANHAHRHAFSDRLFERRLHVVRIRDCLACQFNQ